MVYSCAVCGCQWPQAQWLIVVDLVALTGKCHGGILTVVDKHASASQNVFGPRISSANWRWLASLQEFGGQWAGRFNFVQSFSWPSRGIGFNFCFVCYQDDLCGFSGEMRKVWLKALKNNQYLPDLWRPAAPNGWRSQDVTESASNGGEPQKSFWVRRWERASGLKTLFSLQFLEDQLPLQNPFWGDVIMTSWCRMFFLHLQRPFIQGNQSFKRKTDFRNIMEYHGIPILPWQKPLRGRGKVASDHDDFTALLYQCDWRNGCRFASCGELCSTKRFGFATHGSFSLDPCASSCTSIGCANLGSVGRSESCKTKDLAVCRSLVPGTDGGSCYFKSKPPNKHSWLEIPPWGFQPGLIIRMLH